VCFETCCPPCGDAESSPLLSFAASRIENPTGSFSDGRTGAATFAPFPENLNKSTLDCYKGGGFVPEIARPTDEQGAAKR
jgi:hypothetical protein